MTVIAFITLPSDKVEPAAKFYTETFPDSKISEIDYVEPDGTHKNGPTEKTSQVIAFTVTGQPFIAMGMDPAQVPAPSWANSYMVAFAEVALYDRVFAALSEGGFVMMASEDFGPYKKVCWITDKFGLTWQLVCE